MFKQVSYRIALQFTAFVFVLLLVNGSIFLLADIGNARRQTAQRLVRTLEFVLEGSRVAPNGLPATIPNNMRDRVRIVAPDGTVLYGGPLFMDIPFDAVTGISHAWSGNEWYAVLTTPIKRGDELTGYVQIADIEHVQTGDLPLRALIYIIVSIAISGITFTVGLFFARRSLKPAEQMVERLEQFTQDASHELRTPLAVLTSSLDLALKTKDYKEGIESAKEDVRQVTTLVERLLELARLDSFALSKQSLDLSVLVEDMVAKHRPLAEKQGITLHGDVQPGVTVHGDGALLRQVLGNLLSNAMKFSKPGGGEIHVTLTKDTLTVSDTGVGIPKDELPHIFERFYQVDESRAKGGFGLGLSLVRRIVELHGWSVAAESKKGDGATFIIRFEKVS